MDKGNVSVSFTHAEALVLCDLLFRIEENKHKVKLQDFEDGERNALIRLAGYFDPLLVEPFMENYDELVKEAKDELIEKYGKWES
ncbi:MAG: hypothetical protein MOGMAGMI_01645 [Candidatus Omnitrophica bacterium]|nr:hypothetical protein [Candidatus Omnitrophota bacterium]